MKYSFLSIICCLSLLMCSSCSDAECNPQLIEDCVCTAEYDPVCGCDGVTYSNPCHAECNSITDYTMGECD